MYEWTRGAAISFTLRQLRFRNETRSEINTNLLHLFLVQRFSRAVGGRNDFLELGDLLLEFFDLRLIIDNLIHLDGVGDFFRAARESERRDGLFHVNVGRRDGADDDCQRVSTQSRLQDTSQFRIAVRDVRLGPGHGTRAERVCGLGGGMETWGG